MRRFVPALLKMTAFAAVTMLLTGILAATIANTNFGATSGYTARITSASGLNAGDDVRIAGVRIGQVTDIAIADDNVAEVSFTVARDRELPRLVTATVRYRNLVGQRYLSLNTDVAGEGTLPADGTIPVDRTDPALDLTALFDGFRPLLRALEPDQVNRLSHELIQVLQGEGGTVRSLLRHIGSLTGTLAERDRVIGEVIGNLNSVLGTVNERSPRFADLVDTTERLVTGLAEQREPIGAAVDGMAELTEATSGLLEQVRPGLRRNVGALNDLAGELENSEQTYEMILRNLPDNLSSFMRVTSYGSWFNYYLCGLTGTIGVQALNVDLPILPLPATDEPQRCQVS